MLNVIGTTYIATCIIYNRFGDCIGCNLTLFVFYTNSMISSYIIKCVCIRIYQTYCNAVYFYGIYFISSIWIECECLVCTISYIDNTIRAYSTVSVT
ncbi:hypothetical protein SDC9_127583 [bioreactor metagenome]|uniref:Uncharacterized protein n=1 Tax=bioreactor metagenome TaxID=1076179 RepID=A0A645CTU9_9ZZZZ